MSDFFHLDKVLLISFLCTFPPRSWIDAAVTGGRLVLGLSKKNFTGQAPFSEVELLQTKRVQLPQKSKFLTRQIFYLKLDTEKLQQQQQKQTPKSTSKKSGGSGGSSSSKCFCSGSSRSSSGSSTNNNFISWVGKKDLALPVIKDKLWGPEVAALLAVIHSFNGEPVSIKSSSSSKDEQMNVLEEFRSGEILLLNSFLTSSFSLIPQPGRPLPLRPSRPSSLLRRATPAGDQLQREGRQLALHRLSRALLAVLQHAPGQLPPLPPKLRLPLQRHSPPGALPRLQLPQIGRHQLPGAPNGPRLPGTACPAPRHSRQVHLSLLRLRLEGLPRCAHRFSTPAS